MKKEELQKAWQEVQQRLNIPEFHIHETISQYLEEKNNDLEMMLKTIPVVSPGKEDFRYNKGR